MTPGIFNHVVNRNNGEQRRQKKEHIAWSQASSDAGKDVVVLTHIESFEPFAVVRNGPLAGHIKKNFPGITVLTEGLEAVMADGTYDRIMAKWKVPPTTKPIKKQSEGFRVSGLK